MGGGTRQEERGEGAPSWRISAKDTHIYIEGVINCLFLESYLKKLLGPFKPKQSEL